MIYFPSLKYVSSNGILYFFHVLLNCDSVVKLHNIQLIFLSDLRVNSRILCHELRTKLVTECVYIDSPFSIVINVLSLSVIQLSFCFLLPALQGSFFLSFFQLSYQIVDTLIWLGIRDIINDFRKKKLKLRPVTYLSGSSGSSRDVPYGYVWSPHLVPKPKGHLFKVSTSNDNLWLPEIITFIKKHVVFCYTVYVGISIQ